MRARCTLAALLVVAVVGTGCARTPRDRLQGRWLGQRIENVPPAQLAKATGWVKGAAIEFTDSKVTVTIPAETPRTGSFAATPIDADRMTVNFARAEGGRDEAEFRFVDDKTLRWSLGSGPEIVLIRAN